MLAYFNSISKYMSLLFVHWVYSYHFSSGSFPGIDFFWFADKRQCVSPKFIWWSPNLWNVTAFGDKTFKEVIKVKWDHMNETYCNMTDVLISRGAEDRGKITWRPRKRTAYHKPMRKSSEEINPTDTSVLNI